MTSKRPAHLRVINTETGELYEAAIHAKRPRGGLTISDLYGPNWLALPAGAANALAFDRHLTGAELRVMMLLLSRMRPGNHIDMRPVDVATELGLQRPNAARSIRKLKDAGILIDRKPFGWRFDPNFAFRGNPTGLVGKKRDGSLVLLPS